MGKYHGVQLDSQIDTTEKVFEIECSNFLKMSNLTICLQWYTLGKRPIHNLRETLKSALTPNFDLKRLISQKRNVRFPQNFQNF